jgi:tetratricopeptide (TPR) repeat protein
MTTTSNQFFQLSFPSPARARLEEAEAFFLSGNLNEALAAAQQAWREHPQEADVFRVLAYLHMARGEYTPASTAAYQAVVVDVENPASHAILTQVYLTFNMLGKAEETLVLARQRFPRDASLVVLEADLRFRKHQANLGAQLANQALALNPEDAYAKALLGVYHLRMKAYATSIDLLRAATQAYPQRWDYLRDLGIALLHVGAAAEARAALAQSLRLNPADASTKQHLFLALRQCASSPAIWRVALYFYDHSAFGWLLWILGLLSGIVGFIWLIWWFVPSDSNTSVVYSDLITPMILLLGGIALMVLCHAGIRLHSRRGRNFELRLWKALEDGGQA